MHGATSAGSSSSDSSSVPHSAADVVVSDPLPYDIIPAQQLVKRHEALRYPYHCIFGRARLEIMPGVFCPNLTKTSPWLLELLQFQPGQRVLDIFAGSGAFGINAALHGAHVVLVDISPAAIGCANRNIVRNHVEDLATARLGTMGDCLRKRDIFDLIVANPPLLPGQQTDELSRAIFDPDMRATLDFIQRLSGHLAPTGSCYLLTSDVIDRYGNDIARLCIENNLYSVVLDKLDVGYETYRVHRIVQDTTRART